MCEHVAVRVCMFLHLRSCLRINHIIVVGCVLVLEYQLCVCVCLSAYFFFLYTVHTVHTVHAYSGGK